CGTSASCTFSMPAGGISSVANYAQITYTSTTTIAPRYSTTTIVPRYSSSSSTTTVEPPTTIQYSTTTVKQYSTTTVQQYSTTTVKQYSTTTVQQYSTTTGSGHYSYNNDCYPFDCAHLGYDCYTQYKCSGAEIGCGGYLSDTC
ncbi:MAG: hypothetical protein ACYCO0_05385, partial [Candidatus Micrarchaeaceae archaeon]